MKTQTGRSETSKPAQRLRHAQHKTEAISGELKVAERTRLEQELADLQRSVGQGG